MGWIWEQIGDYPLGLLGPRKLWVFPGRGAGIPTGVLSKESRWERDQIHTRAAPTPIHITGHSMGGAIGMLAALEIAHLRRCRNHPTSSVSTCTFATPRLGDAAFAALYERTFPRAEDHWALAKHATADAVVAALMI